MPLNEPISFSALAFTHGPIGILNSLTAMLMNPAATKRPTSSLEDTRRLRLPRAAPSAACYAT